MSIIARWLALFLVQSEARPSNKGIVKKKGGGGWMARAEGMDLSAVLLCRYLASAPLRSTFLLS